MTEQAQIEGKMADDNAVKLPELWTKDAIKQDQDGIRVSLTKLDGSIHANAVQCLMHAEKHGDTSLMRRLLVDIVDAKSGYRRQGIIAWMRKYSPMELNKDVINLSGTLADGSKRPFRVEEANKSPFTGSNEFAERVGKPIYRDTLLSKVNLAIKEFKNAVANTVVVNGQNTAIDPKKPFYDGINLDKMRTGFEQIESNVIEIQAWKDSTKDVRTAQEMIRKSTAELEQAQREEPEKATA